MSPFQAIGAQARWRTVYEMLCAVPVNGVLTYQDMGDALVLHPQNDRHAIQMAMRRAAREHEQVDHRAVEAVPGVGYRVVEAAEHLRLARGHQSRAGRALERGHSKVVHVDLTGMDGVTRHAFEVIARAFTMQADFNSRLDVRQKNLEDAVNSMSKQAERTEAELAALKARMARIEGQDAD